MVTKEQINSLVRQAIAAEAAASRAREDSTREMIEELEKRCARLEDHNAVLRKVVGHTRKQVSELLDRVAALQDPDAIDLSATPLPSDSGPGRSSHAPTPERKVG